MSIPETQAGLSGFYIMSVKLKPFKTFDEQVDRLKDVHKLTIKESDRGNVIFALETINYYSLRGYGLCFETKKPRKNLHKYKRNTTINDIKYIYNFDSKLKSEVLRIIGLIENNLKTIFAYYFVKNHKLDPECYMLPQNYYKGNDAIEIFKKIKKQKIKYVNGVPCPRDKNDLVIKNHIQKYNAQFPM